MRGLAQLPATPLVANPAGDADREAERAIGLELERTARETVGNCAHEAPRIVGENGDKVLVRVALVQEHGLTDVNRDFQLRDEGGALRGARAESRK